MMGFNHMFLGGWSWLVTLVWFIFLVVGVIALIQWLCCRTEDYSRRFASQPTPLDTLKERYARGEITKKEFEEKKRELM